MARRVRLAIKRNKHVRSHHRLVFAEAPVRTKHRSFQKYTKDLKMRDSEWEDKRENSRALNVFYVRLDGKKERYFMIMWAGSCTWIHGWLQGGPFSSVDNGPG